jgi:hypothetical protein
MICFTKLILFFADKDLDKKISRVQLSKKLLETIAEAF